MESSVNNPMCDPATLEKQYKTSQNLDIRRALHDKYSTNKQGAAAWFLDNITFFDGCRILELGCGNGAIWQGRLGMIGEGSQLVLSDISDGMLENAKQRFAGVKSVCTECIDIQNIPYNDDSFDIVIANSMLYHVPDLDRGLSEVRRVLKPGGVFYATTTGGNGLPKYIDETLQEFGIYSYIADNITFSLNNGAAQLKKYFDDVLRIDYEDSLEITDAADLADYILSTVSMTRIAQRIDRDGLIEFYNSKKNTQGIIHIPKEFGMFRAVNP